MTRGKTGRRQWGGIVFALLCGALFVLVFLIAVYLRPQWWTP